MCLFRQAKRERRERELEEFDPYSDRRVARGAALLDRKTPGWDTKINTGILDIDRTDHCILGQLYGGYVAGVKEFGVELFEPQGKRFAYNHGFVNGEDTQEWVLLINKRQLARSA